MNVIANNLNEIAKTFASARKMASAIGISPTTLNEYLKGRVPPADFVVNLCESLSINHKWLLTGKGNMHNDDEFIYVPLLDDIKAAAGVGYIPDNEDTTRVLCFRKDWISQNNVTANTLSAIHVSGDSMYPTLINGDTLLVDHSQTQPIADRIFVVRTEDGLIVKRSGGLTGTILFLLSDNPSIKERQVDLSSDAIQVIGRVVWYGRTL